MQEEIHDPTTGEVLQSIDTRSAADGAIIPAAAFTGGDIINQLEDGAFQADMHAAIANMLAKMNDVSQMTGKAKGSVTIKLDFSKEDNAIRIASKFTVKEPEEPRPRSIMWTDPQHNLTRFPPNQMQLMGLKSVGGNGGLRRA